MFLLWLVGAVAFGASEHGALAFLHIKPAAIHRVSEQSAPASPEGIAVGYDTGKDDAHLSSQEGLVQHWVHWLGSSVPMGEVLSWSQVSNGWGFGSLAKPEAEGIRADGAVLNPTDNPHLVSRGRTRISKSDGEREELSWQQVMQVQLPRAYIRTKLPLRRFPRKRGQFCCGVGITGSNIQGPTSLLRSGNGTPRGARILTHSEDIASTTFLQGPLRLSKGDNQSKESESAQYRGDDRPGRCSFRLARCLLSSNSSAPLSAQIGGVVVASIVAGVGIIAAIRRVRGRRRNRRLSGFALLLASFGLLGFWGWLASPC